ncbi:MAG: redoxin domain-containing protein [Chloroflexi bacterium]|nr:redoxin domain-containing protein [Chloroflexota bacterium]
MDARSLLDLGLLVARLFLAVTFAVAALAKLRSPASTREAMAEFGIPAALAGSAAVAVPLVELAVAAALVFVPTAWYGAVAAVALLTVFVLAMLVNLARGRRPDCRCFGEVTSQPIGLKTVLRNVILAAIGLFVAIQGPADPGPSVFAWLTPLSVSDRVFAAVMIACIGLLVVVAWIIAQLLAQNGRLLNRLEALEEFVAGGAAGLEAMTASRGASSAQNGIMPQPTAAPASGPGLPLGTRAPSFELPGVEGELRSLDGLLASEVPVMLVFADPGCGPCNALMPEIGTWQRAYSDLLTIALISRGTPDSNRAKRDQHGLQAIVLQANYEVADSFEAHGTPSAVVVNADGTIGSFVAAGADAIRGLLADTLQRLSSPPGEQPQLLPMAGQHDHQHTPTGAGIGRPAPGFELDDLDGRQVGVGDLRGERTLLLFWNLGCGFCQQMLPRLKEWEASAPPGAPRLVLVSSGSREDNRAMGLRSTVLIDPSGKIGGSYQAYGTPMAVMIDANGTIASNVAAGAEEVMRLAASDAGRSVPAAG